MRKGCSIPFIVLLITNSLLIIFSLISVSVKALDYWKDTDLSNVDASFLGEDEYDVSGCSVVGAGDVNGDGYDDILIGAYGNDDGDDKAGQTYLILGKTSGWSMDTDLSASDASFWGEDTGDLSGYRVAGIGDVNGDGYDDILIGAYGDDDGGDFAGQTYLILGKASGWSMDTDLSESNASFRGENSDDNSGWSVAGVGDVNGDGFDDVLIGAPCNDDGSNRAGQTYLILGKVSGWAMNTNLSEADASFWGENEHDQSGVSVAGVGDINGDGYDDILIGANGNNDGGSYAGQAYLILGKPSGWAMDTELSDSDASFLGETEHDYSGCSIAGAGDVNGDGYDDILIGADCNDDGGEHAGQTYLILGNASGWVMDTDLSDSDASFIGEKEYDYSGRSVAGAGDVNGDGYDDILIGAFGNDQGGYTAGQTYIILGKTSGWAMYSELSDSDASFLGANINDYSGCSVASAGDVNGDGYDEILVGAKYSPERGRESGQTYLVFPTHNSGPVLHDEFLTPINGDTSTNVKFSIMYKDIDGHAPVNISLVIDNCWHTMTSINTTTYDYKNGVQHVYTLKLSGGLHQYYYYTSDGFLNAGYPLVGNLTTPYIRYLSDEPTANDTDGDGYYNTYEIEMASNPNDKSSTPLDRDGDGVLNAEDVFPDDRTKWDRDEKGSRIVRWELIILIALLAIGFIIKLAVASRKKQKEDIGTVDKFGRVKK